jgi:phosphopantetheinyl transferase
MGLIFKNKIDNDCLLGMWEITEDYNTLYNSVQLNEEERSILNNFKNEKRKLEWLSVRVLVSNLVNNGSRITYRNRKPFLNDGSYHISISHSNMLTSVLLSSRKRVGIDLEYISPKAERIAHKFINQKEFIVDKYNSQRNYHLYLHWCGKEAIYKICDKQNINLRENITLEPFEIKEYGNINAILHRDGMQLSFTLNYKKYKDYVIVWTCKDLHDDI